MHWGVVLHITKIIAAEEKNKKKSAKKKRKGSKSKDGVSDL